MNLNRQTNRWCPPRARYPAMFRKTEESQAAFAAWLFAGYMNLFP